MLDRREEHPLLGFWGMHEYVSGVANMLSMISCKEEGWRQLQKWWGSKYERLLNNIFDF